jgi:EAL domain-containing protein (putative c-di-GMP-specific phosphodiesterase class I)
MAHELKMTVVAEGVETETQAAWLQTNGCDMIHGDLVHGPLSAEGIGDMIEGTPGTEHQAA